MENSFPKLILITGPKHAGKTASGAFLAGLLGAEFVDLDELVERQTGRSPRSLFKEGPEVFRQAEAQALAGILSLTLRGTAGRGQDGGAAWVVAAGGGLADNAGALELLRQPGFSGDDMAIVCLEVAADTAWERIRRTAQETGEWPAFLNGENPRETNAALHARRSDAYRKLATLTVNGEGKSPETLGREIAIRLAPANSPKETLRG